MVLGTNVNDPFRGRVRLRVNVWFSKNTEIWCEFLNQLKQVMNTHIIAKQERKTNLKRSLEWHVAGYDAIDYM